MHRVVLSVAAFSLLVWVAGPVTAQDWEVTLRLHEAYSKTNDDGAGDDDMYMKVFSGTEECNLFDRHIDGARHIIPVDPTWECTFDVAGPDPTLSLSLQLWEEDNAFTGSDDHFDIHPAPGVFDIAISFRPQSQQILLQGVPDWDQNFRCAEGPFEVEGFESDDHARVRFSVSGSEKGGNGDTDLDGLPDSIEICGAPGVNLPAMGADPYRKDVFVEIDWFRDDDGAGLADHTHAPWLPALMNAWHEFDSLGVANPARPDGQPTPTGISLHLDTGALFEGYLADHDNNGVPEVQFDADGDGFADSVDLNGDGVPDIGDLGRLGGGAGIGGNRICADLTPAPCTSALQQGESETLLKVQADTVRRLNFDAARDEVFRYSVFGHRFAPCDSTSGGHGVGSTPGRRIGIAVMLARPEPGCGGWGIEAAPNGPGGAVVHGLIREHTGTFLHELGHALGLKHGGGDDVNYKPNYLSVMNYRWTNDGIPIDADLDGTVDQLAIDFNYDGNLDDRRFAYSDADLPDLNEMALNESAGISGADRITLFNCPGTGGLPQNPRRRGMAAGPIDWDCDGIAAIPDPAADIDAAPVQANINGSFTDTNGNNRPDAGEPATWQGPADPLTGFNDYEHLENHPLRGPTREEYDADHVNWPRAVSYGSERSLGAACGVVPERVDFERLAVGTRVSDQLATIFDLPVRFLADARRVPIIDAEAFRSPTRALLNANPGGGDPAPLVITLSEPMRAVGVFVGHIAQLDARDVVASMTAYDAGGELMGQTETRDIGPDFDGFLGLGSFYPLDGISRVEVAFLAGAQGVEVRVDDLALCATARRFESPTASAGPQSINLDILSEVVAAGDNDPQTPGQLTVQRVSLSNVQLQLDGAPVTTATATNRPLGQSARLLAPPQHQSWVFSHWEIAKGNHRWRFPQGQTGVELKPGSDMAAVAVYRPPVLNLNP